MTSVTVLLIILQCALVYSQTKNPIIACYVTSTKHDYDNIPDGLCTHYLHIGYGSVDWLGNFVGPEPNLIKNFTNLRNRHKSKPTMLLTLGASNPHWSRLISFKGNMEKFANAAKKYLTENGFQGLDLDWEFPYWSGDGAVWDREGFSQLIEILHNTFSPAGLIVTSAVSGPPTITRVAYDVPKLDKYLDYVFIMNYDFHVWHENAPFVGFNAPLHPLSQERYALKEMNSESAMSTWIQLGLSPSKAIYGIPTYNLGYLLANGRFHTIFSFATEETYEYTNHAKTCNLSKTEGWVEKWNDHAASPYLYNVAKKLWITNENERSVRAKAKFAAEKGYGGLMVYALDTDDEYGVCQNEPFPLINNMKLSFLKQHKKKHFKKTLKPLR